MVKAPRGDLALATIGNEIFVMAVPDIGGPRTPMVLVSKPDSAAVPVKKLSEVGGEFATWGADGRTVHYSIGNAFFTWKYDSALANPNYRPQETRIRISANRDIPQGTVVLRGALHVEFEGGSLEVRAGQAVVTAPGEWVRYSTPEQGGAEYIAVCTPAFSPGTVHRDET